MLLRNSLATMTPYLFILILRKMAGSILCHVDLGVIFLLYALNLSLHFLTINMYYLWDWASQLVLVVRNPPAKAGDVTDTGSTPELGRSPGEGHGNPLQYSCLEDPHGQRSLPSYGVTDGHTTEAKQHGCAFDIDFQHSWSSAVNEQWKSLVVP